MRILIQHPKYRHTSIARGWINVFNSLGHESYLWSPEKPAFDAFDEVKPDVFILTGGAGKVPPKCLKINPNLKVIDQTEIEAGLDTHVFRLGEAREEFACDVAFVGSYRPEKQALLNRFVLPLLDRYKVKLFGLGRWCVPQHLGLISDQDLPDLYASARVCLNISEGRFGERAFQIIGCGGACVSYDEGGESFVKTWKFSSVEGLQDRIRSVWGTRKSYLLRLRDEVLENHTYYHRVASMFKGIGLDREAEKVLSAYEVSREQK